MQRRALLIGCPVGALRATERDVGSVGAFLEAHGFSVDARCGPAATRDAILDGYRRLVADSGDGDAALVYYSGHGGLAVNPAPEPGEPEQFQFIVPIDIARSTDAEFFGITSLELSALQAELTARTANVTVILDCCHAARMSRAADPRLMVKALPAPWALGVGAHVERLRAAGRFAAPTQAEGNPLAVRLVAAAHEQSAFEYLDGEMQPAGLFTESLLLALREADGLPVSWQAVARRAAERVLEIAPDQRPDVEGPLRRRLFALDEVDAVGATVYASLDGVPALRGGRLLGMTEGDEYAIALPDRRVIARVVEVRSSWARVTIDPPGEIPLGVEAVPLAGRASSLRDLASGTGAAALAASWRVSWGLVARGAAAELPASGAALHAGDHFWIRFDNASTDPLYLSIYDVGVAGRGSLLSASEGSGIRVEPGKQVTIGELPGRGLCGVPLGWPAAVPRDAPRGETLIAVVTDAPVDLRGAERSAQRPPAEARYAVARLEFMLDPEPRPDHG